MKARINLLRNNHALNKWENLNSCIGHKKKNKTFSYLHKFLYFSKMPTFSCHTEGNMKHHTEIPSGPSFVKYIL
jgi:hypothetical protein